jgi:hypothetical protein
VLTGKEVNKNSEGRKVNQCMERGREEGEHISGAISLLRPVSIVPQAFSATVMDWLV